ncbi:MAG: hypothetical protein OEM62_11085, partial [Acidobacteriota bacterium]|nr:hypothetical protein [Acidobacteriota bacterium]
MIDIHLHCLPGLDDGPGTIDEAAAICRLAAADGSDTLIATPHQRVGSWWNCDPGRLEALRRELQRRVGATPRILLGAEVRIDRDLIEDLDSDDQGGILTLAGTDYVLLEYSRSGPFVDAEDLVHELTLQGRRPVFAHPEFTPGLG